MNQKHKQHIGHWKDHISNMDETQNVLDTMKHMDTYDSHQAFGELKNRLAEDGLLPKRKLSSIKKWMPLSAAAIFIGIIVGTLFMTKPITVQNHSMAPKIVQLPDGSNIYLNTNASLSYSKKFQKSHRNIKLDGEAFFDVAKNKALPFVISTKQTKITVLGTSFNVKPIQNSLGSEILVESGVVRIEDRHRNKQSLTLKTSEYGRINKHKAKRIDANPDINYLSWKTQKLIFEDEPLSKALNDISKVYHTNIELNDANLSKRRITATYDQLTIDELLKSLELTMNIQVKQNKDGHYQLSSKE